MVSYSMLRVRQQKALAARNIMFGLLDMPLLELALQCTDDMTPPPKVIQQTAWQCTQPDFAG